MPLNPVVAKAMPHFWEEPCISGKNGSGAVFFSGCTLGCVFCQNAKISHEGYGKELTSSELRKVFDRLIDKGVHNINLVTPSHFSDKIIEAIGDGLPVPVIFNSSGYELVDTIRKFENKVQIYLPDFKYSNSKISKKYSLAEDYPEIAKSAIIEMYRQVGSCRFDDNGMLLSGVVIRHLILPQNTKNTFGVIDWVAKTFPKGDVIFSLMSQYTPPKDMIKYPELSRRISKREYEKCCNYMLDAGIENGFVQELSSAKEEYTPDFDLSGI